MSRKRCAGKRGVPWRHPRAIAYERWGLRRVGLKSLGLGSDGSRT